MNKRIIISIILVVFWMSFIFMMSNMNRDDSNNASTSIAVDIIHKIDQITKASNETIKRHQSDEFIAKINHLLRKFSHAFEYFALAILTFNLLLQIMKNKLLFYNLFTIIICFIYACSDEYHQTFIDGRGGMFSDVLIDTLGAIVGCFMINLVYILTKRYLKKKN